MNRATPGHGWPGSFSAAIGVPAVVDIEDVHRVGGLVDLVAHPIFSSARTPVAVERRSQRCADTSRGHHKRSGDELPGRDGRRLGQKVGERAPGTWSQDEPVGLVIHEERRGLGFA